MIDPELIVCPESQIDPLPPTYSATNKEPSDRPAKPEVRAKMRTRKAVEYMGAVRCGINALET